MKPHIRLQLRFAKACALAALVAATVGAALSCATPGQETRALIAEVERQIRPDMPRSQVETALAELGLFYTPQPEAESPIWIHTPYEEDPGRLSWGSIEIHFDSNDRVERVDARHRFSGI